VRHIVLFPVDNTRNRYVLGHVWGTIMSALLLRVIKEILFKM